MIGSGSKIWIRIRIRFFQRSYPDPHQNYLDPQHCLKAVLGMDPVEVSYIQYIYRYRYFILPVGLHFKKRVKFLLTEVTKIHLDILRFDPLKYWYRYRYHQKKKKFTSTFSVPVPAPVRYFRFLANHEKNFLFRHF
jgi:hypothetical protein